VLGLFGSAAAEVSYEYYKAAITNTGGSWMPPYDTWIPNRTGTGGSWMPPYDTWIPNRTGTGGRFDIKYRERGDDFAFRLTGYIVIQTQGECFFYAFGPVWVRFVAQTAFVVTTVDKSPQIW